MNSQRGCHIAIILPTYCESENIVEIIDAIEKLEINSTILVIDDSSPDETSNVVSKMKEKHKNIMLIKRPHKMGLGTAITDGFRFILSHQIQAEYIITMDADYSHDPKDIPRFLKCSEKGCDLVVGSRYCHKGDVKGWNFTRTIISKVANKLTGILLKISINDFTSGFRCYSKEYLTKALSQLHSETYEIQIETLRQAKLQKSRIVEIPIIFENRKKGKSKLRLKEITAVSRYIMKLSTEKILKKIITK